MGESAMAMTRDQKEAIESVALNFMEKHIKDFVPQALYRRELDLVERVTRVEEELKSQRELMINSFEAMDKRFEEMQHYMDKRFDQVDKRYAFMKWMMGIGFSSILVVTTVLKFLA